MALSATYKALNTFDILSNIMLHLPKADLAQAEQTAKIWQAVIEKTPEVRRRHQSPALQCAAQTGLETPFDYWSPPSELCSQHMLNGQYRFIEFEQFLRPCAFDPGRSCVLKTGITIGKAQGISRLRQQSYLYATSPLVQALKLVSSPLGRNGHQIRCVVYVKAGVRLGHLIDAAQGIWDSDERYARLHRAYVGKGKAADREPQVPTGDMCVASTLVFSAYQPTWPQDDGPSDHDSSNDGALDDNSLDDDDFTDYDDAEEDPSDNHQSADYIAEAGPSNSSGLHSYTMSTEFHNTSLPCTDDLNDDSDELADQDKADDGADPGEINIEHGMRAPLQTKRGRRITKKALAKSRNEARLCKVYESDLGSA